MPTVRRSRRIAATPEAIWKVLDDPHHLPRYWPRVRRVEGVERDVFTLVLVSDRGRTVRADYAVESREAPTRRVWHQELIGTPFERFLRESRTSAMIEGVQDGSTVTLELRQRARGLSRLGGIFLRRAAGTQLENALDGLARICG